MVEITIEKEKCSGCGVCVVSCPINSKNLETAAGKPQPENSVIFIVNGCCTVLNNSLCIGCGTCMKACPSKAIVIKK